jgi:hypothetical protein
VMPSLIASLMTSLIASLMTSLSPEEFTECQL